MIFSSNSKDTFYDLVESCVNDTVICKKLTLFQDEDYVFSLDKFNDVEIDCADRIIDYSKYFKNNNLRLIIDKVPDSEVEVLEDGNDVSQGTSLVPSDSEDDRSNISLATNNTLYDQQALLYVAETLDMAYNADGTRNVDAGNIGFLQKIKSKLFKIKNQQIDKSIKKVEESAKFDLCFMVDCTGSMQKHIDGVRDKIKSLLSDSFRRYPEHAARIAFVGYRDYGDSYDGLFLDFTDDSDMFCNHLSKIKAEGAVLSVSRVKNPVTRIMTYTTRVRHVFHFSFEDVFSWSFTNIWATIFFLRFRKCCDVDNTVKEVLIGVKMFLKASLFVIT